MGSFLFCEAEHVPAKVDAAALGLETEDESLQAGEEREDGCEVEVVGRARHVYLVWLAGPGGTEGRTETVQQWSRHHLLEREEPPAGVEPPDSATINHKFIITPL